MNPWLLLIVLWVTILTPAVLFLWWAFMAMGEDE